MNKYIILLGLISIFTISCNKNINYCCSKNQKNEDRLKQELTKALLDISVDKINKYEAKPITYLILATKTESESSTISILYNEDEASTSFKIGIDNLVKSKNIIFKKDTIIPIIIRLVDRNNSSIKEPDFYKDVKEIDSIYRSKMLEPICINIFQ